MAQLAEAVRYLHLEHNVALRDLCPQNILVYKNERLPLSVLLLLLSSM